MLTLMLALCLAAGNDVHPTIGVIADDLVDYSQWVSQHKDLWRGSQVLPLLEDRGARPTLLRSEDLTLEGFSRFDAILISTDHTYPERGAWGGPVAKALVEYVRGGGVYVMPIGIPHWSSKDLETGRLESGHWNDFFDLRGSAAAGRGPLALTRQGQAISLPDPAGLDARPVRSIDCKEQAVLVWSADYLPCLSAIPFGKGWLLNWLGGPEGTMAQGVRDYLMSAAVSTLRAAKGGRLKATDMRGLMAAEGLAGKSLDDLDRRSFAPGRSPFESRPIEITLSLDDPPAPAQPFVRKTISLDGTWEMMGVPTGAADPRSMVQVEQGRGWHAAIGINIPCSVQTGLFTAGKIPDPAVGFNDQIARQEVAAKEWWFRKGFDRPGTGQVRLIFDGVDYSATFWLNGHRLGEHEGPFGGPEYDVTSLLREHNVLVVRLDPLPPDWKQVFKTNCVYGWHYVACPPIGIWQSVRLELEPEIKIHDLFVAAADAQKGLINLATELDGPESGFRVSMEGLIRPANFQGKAYRFKVPIESRAPHAVRHWRLTLPEPRLWWPVDLGEPNLYRLDLVIRDGERVIDGTGTRFGVRTIRMAPTPGGPAPHQYNWTFVINGRPTFMKGCNWCTLDAFLRLTPDRYRRFLTLAKDEHIQIMRSWGGGLLETDTFYNLCDEMGIMVMQEFPLTWQVFDNLRLSVSDEIAHRNIVRIRNHPSLAMWCGGNEHQGQGPLIELLGRRCLELDGTRPYHRTDPYGGSLHDYGVYWGRQPFEHYLTLVPYKNGPIAIGETGLASPCAVESTLRFLPEPERQVWPPPDNGTFIHHTPTFTRENMDFLNRHAKELDPCADLAGFTRGAQLAQALGLRLVLERMRCNWPQATAMIFYKLTDVYPGCSWATVDYYGVPKIAHDFVRNAFAPLHVCALFESLDAEPGKPLKIRAMLLDDTEQLAANSEITVRLFNGLLKEVAAHQLLPRGKPERVQDLGELALPIPDRDAAPLLLVLDLRREGKLLDRTWYWFNFRCRPGCLFQLPRTTLRAEHQRGRVTMTNTGQTPAVGVQAIAPEASDSLRVSDGHLWLNPGETRIIGAELMANVDGHTPAIGVPHVTAWNADPARAR
ncbi:MAG: hypothetical protein KA354_01295 [Phycisphaerae bacterium]|nr:hypothetical protein [Phycisphaerae bacterium]